LTGGVFFGQVVAQPKKFDRVKDFSGGFGLK
jgi:hypothetical protein